MLRAVMYMVIGTAISFFLNYYLIGSKGWMLDLYYGFAFGLAWGLAYFVDRPQWALSKKMGISFIGIALLVGIGFLFFSFEWAVPSIVRFSTVFVAYYMIASFRESKSLRQ